VARLLPSYPTSNHHLPSEDLEESEYEDEEDEEDVERGLSPHIKENGQQREIVRLEQTTRDTLSDSGSLFLLISSN